MFLDIFLIVAKIFKRFNIFNNINVNLSKISSIKELLSIKELSSIKRLSTKSSIVCSNCYTTSQKTLQSIIYSTSKKQELIN